MNWSNILLATLAVITVTIITYYIAPESGHKAMAVGVGYVFGIASKDFI